MSEQIVSPNNLAAVGHIKISNQSAQKGISSNSPLGEKFQFSSVLKSTYTDRPDETYSEIRKPKSENESIQYRKEHNTELDAPIGKYNDVSISDNEDTNAEAVLVTNENAPPVNNESRSDNSLKNSDNENKTPISSDKNQPDNDNNQNIERGGGDQQKDSSPNKNSDKKVGNNEQELIFSSHPNAASGTDKQASSIVLETSEKPKSLEITPISSGSQIDIATPTEQKVSIPNSNVEKIGGKVINQPNQIIQTEISKHIVTEKNTQNFANAKFKISDNSGSETVKMAGEIVTPVLKDAKTPHTGDIINKVLPKHLKEDGNTQSVTLGSNANVTKQERNLSNHLKKNSHVPVKVTVENTNNKTIQPFAENISPINNAMPSHTKAPIAELAELSLEESQAPLFKSTSVKVGGAKDSKVANNHSITTNANAAANSQNEKHININQLLGQQAAAMGAQQSAANQSAMGPKTAITADVPNITAALAPNGPNQASQQITKAAPPPPPPPPKPPLPVDQVAVQIKKAIGEGADKINIKLVPARLGSVEVKMEIARDGQLAATIVAERPETLELLQRDVRGLEKALQDGGLKIDPQSFNFNLKEQAQQQAAANPDQSNEGQDINQSNGSDENKDQGTNQETDIDPQTSVYGQNLATNGGVDIRV